MVFWEMQFACRAGGRSDARETTRPTMRRALRAEQWLLPSHGGWALVARIWADAWRR